MEGESVWWQIALSSSCIVGLLLEAPTPDSGSSRLLRPAPKVILYPLCGEGDIHSSASWTIRQGRAICKEDCDWVLEERIALTQCHGYIILCFLSEGESLKFSYNANGLGLRLLSGRVDAGNITEPNGIEGSRRHRAEGRRGL